MLDALVTLESLKWEIPLVGAVVAWLINERWKRSEHRREIKRQACLQALEIVDAHFSNEDWIGMPEPERQTPPDIQRARDVYNKLCLSCSNDAVLKAYKRCLGLYGPFTAAEIVDLRNAIIAELGFGGHFDTDREKAWISRLSKPMQGAEGRDA